MGSSGSLGVLGWTGTEYRSGMRSSRRAFFGINFTSSALPNFIFTFRTPFRTDTLIMNSCGMIPFQTVVSACARSPVSLCAPCHAPSGQQRPEDIKHLLQEAKAGRQKGISPGAVLGGGDAAGAVAGADDTMIEEAIQASPCPCRAGAGTCCALLGKRCASHSRSA